MVGGVQQGPVLVGTFFTMPNQLLKRAKRNTIHKVYIYSGVTCPFAFDRCTAQWSL